MLDSTVVNFILLLPPNRANSVNEQGESYLIGDIASSTDIRIGRSNGEVQRGRERPSENDKKFAARPPLQRRVRQMRVAHGLFSFFMSASIPALMPATYAPLLNFGIMISRLT